MRESTNKKACFENASAVADIVKNNKLNEIIHDITKTFEQKKKSNFLQQMLI